MSAFDAVAAQDYELLLPRPVLDPELNGSCSTRFDLDYILHLTSLLKSTHTGEADYRPSFESSETCPSPSADLIQRLATELRTWSEDIRKLRDEQAACMVQAVQDWLDIAPRSHPFRSAALCLVVKIAASSEKLPSSLFLPDVKLESRDSFFGGGFADIYRGMYEGHKVAIKKPRALSAVSNPYARLCREALIWYQLRHPFVLPFIGVDRDNFEATNLVGLVTPWISPGTLKDVMKSDRFDAEIDPYVWLDEIAQGLAYLHEENVVHGDLNDVNILITDEKRVQIADFGQASVAEKSGIGMTATSTNAGSCAWMSPQRANEEGHERNEADDVYAYGCLAYTLFTGCRLFHNLSEQGVLHKVSIGQRPERPSRLEPPTPLHDQIWSLVTTCWSQECSDRLSMAQVAAVTKDVRLAQLQVLHLDLPSQDQTSLTLPGKTVTTYRSETESNLTLDLSASKLINAAVVPWQPSVADGPSYSRPIGQPGVHGPAGTLPTYRAYTPPPLSASMFYQQPWHSMQEFGRQPSFQTMLPPITRSAHADAQPQPQYPASVAHFLPHPQQHQQHLQHQQHQHQHQYHSPTPPQLSPSYSASGRDGIHSTHDNSRHPTVIDLTSAPPPPPPLPAPPAMMMAQGNLPPDLPLKTPVCIGQLQVNALVLYPIAYLNPSDHGGPDAEWTTVRTQYVHDPKRPAAAQETVQIRSPTWRNHLGEIIGVVEQNVATALGPMLGKGLIRVEARVRRGRPNFSMLPLILLVYTPKGNTQVVGNFLREQGLLLDHPELPADVQRISQCFYSNPHNPPPGGHAHAKDAAGGGVGGRPGYAGVGPGGPSRWYVPTVSGKSAEVQRNQADKLFMYMDMFS